uniref:BACK domain-containing protein n=2 Tax=Ciona intestinalis TaxID=7719 RepID=H2XXW7_CIOIN
QSTVFRSILTWIKHDFKQRQHFFERLFQLIDVKQLSTTFLEEIVEKSENWIKRLEVYFDVITPEYIRRLKTTEVIENAPDGKDKTNRRQVHPLPIMPRFPPVSGKKKYGESLP